MPASLTCSMSGQFESISQLLRAILLILHLFVIQRAISSHSRFISSDSRYGENRRCYREHTAVISGLDEYGITPSEAMLFHTALTDFFKSRHRYTEYFSVFCFCVRASEMHISASAIFTHFAVIYYFRAADSRISQHI